MKNLKKKIEYGDWQTPDELANAICVKLLELGITPDTIIEPTCGTGAFVKAAAQSFSPATQIIGIEINQNYLDLLQSELSPTKARISLQQGDFFNLNWKELLRRTSGQTLVLGNLPWVTNSVQGAIGGVNLPNKDNFQLHSGLDALTGKSNFDISEWMLMRLAEALRECQGTLAMLCKTAVARKLMNYLRHNHYPVDSAAIFKIDAAKYFDAAVDACLLFCRFGNVVQDFDYTIHNDLVTASGCRTGWRNNVMVSNLSAFDQAQELFGKSAYKWRSGIKHDCAEVMEMKRINGVLQNGLGEVVEIEETFLYPLLKGSDIANDRVNTTERYLLVPQKSPGDDTRGIREFAPQTWKYLESHTAFFERRKSRIYLNSPRFSVFGVGDYTFANWKIAICGLYKKLDFRLIGTVHEKPIVFDDTIYFLSFATEAEARKILSFLTLDKTQKFLTSMIFWDEKRLIKSAVLNSLKLPHSHPQTNWLLES